MKHQADNALNSTKRSYSVDLAAHLRACEMNYHRLISILPGLRDGSDEWCFEAGDKARIQIRITLKESAPYTSVVEVTQSREGLELPGIVLRLCHDADVAEVIAFAGHRHWQGRYDYPNPRMYQPDEKAALNRFLAEWLVFCRKHGVVPPDNCESALVSRRC